jgi:hypothetical protein
VLRRAKGLRPRPRNNGKPVKDWAKIFLPKEVEQKLITLNYFRGCLWDDFSGPADCAHLQSGPEEKMAISRALDNLSSLHVEVKHRGSAPKRYTWEIRPVQGLSVKESHIQYES